MKDHELRELVNALTETALEFSGTQQLRERIAGVVLPAIASKDAEKARIAQMELALRIISNWKLPDTGKYWDEPNKQRPMSYSACYGSNGERDHMRQIANSALTPNEK